MRFESAYILSWLGDNVPYRDKRVKAHLTQVEWFLSLGIKPIVLAQDFKDDCRFPGVEYIDIPKQDIYMGELRNTLLKRFYSSDEDYAIFVDDDSVIYSGHEKYADGDSIFQTMRAMDIGNMDDVDIFFPISPVFEPFSAYNEKNKKSMLSNFHLERSARMKGSMFFLKNLRKHHSKELYMKDDLCFFNGKFVGGEDNIFAYDALSMGLGVYKCRNLILKEMCSANSTWSNSSEDPKDLNEGRKGYTENLDNVVKSLYGVERKKFFKQYDFKPSRLVLNKIKQNNFKDFL